MRTMASLETLNFDNLALRSLPVEENESEGVRQVRGACFSRVKPTPVKDPKVVAVSESALELLDIGKDEIGKASKMAEYFSGNRILPGSETASHCYCGHQFGYFSGQLGDGAAIYLGEVVNKRGERWELQLKGAGPTPYSRMADGRKVLRSSLREFLCSEAIHFLGIPTTRAGTCVTSGTTVVRDMFYDGHAKEEQVTIISRIASTFVRFGSFEICKPMDSVTGRQGPSYGNSDVIKSLIDYTIRTFFPEIGVDGAATSKVNYLEWLKEVSRLTARLVAKWQCVGFCHGVLNTDNMSIVGLTIDYGPFGFMDRYDPDFICNASDDGGRYTYSKQPEICRWNCEKLAEDISEFLPLETSLPEVRRAFDSEFEKCYLKGMRRKLGLLKENDDDKKLIEFLLTTMQETGADFTNTFRTFNKFQFNPKADSKVRDEAVESLCEMLLVQCCTLIELKEANKPGMDSQQLQMLILLLDSNPQLVQQLGRVQHTLFREMAKIEAIKKFEKMTEADKRRADREKWLAWLHAYTDRLCGDFDYNGDVSAWNQKRKNAMDQSNPQFILRNFVAQHAISVAENGDFSEVKRVLKLLESPFAGSSRELSLDVGPQAAGPSKEKPDFASVCSPMQTPDGETVAYDSRPPLWASSLRVS